MNNRFTIVLFVVFVAALGLLWLADYSQWKGLEGDKRRDQLVLPDLEKVKPIDITRIEIDGGKEPVVLERRGEDDWQLTKPADALADRTRVDALLGNLKGLRKIGDEPSIQGDPARYGLAKPVRVIRLFTKASSKPVAELELGDTNQNGRYVRPVGAKGIEVANASMLAAADIAPTDWREQRLIPATSFALSDVAVSRGGRKVLEVAREGAKWRLKEPIRAPADEIKIQGLLGDLTGLHVVDGAKGFVADNVDAKGLARFGLDRPRMTIAVVEGQPSGKEHSLTIAIGKAVGDRADRAFARRTDQDDVVLIDPTAVADLGTRPSSFRSSKLADFDPETIDHIHLKVGKVEHELKRVKEKDRERWEILKPSKAEADPRTVQNLLARLSAVEASDFLDPDKVADAGLHPPAAEITLWKADEPKEDEEGKAASKPKKAESAAKEPAFELTIGRHEAAKKVVLATTPGDPRTLLALPDNILEALPRGPLSFRDRTIVSGISPNAIDRVVVATKARTTVLEAPSNRPGDFDHWRLTKPVDAAADSTLIKLLVQLLANLRADDFVAEKADDPKAYGLDEPHLMVAWQWKPENASATKAGAEPGERTLKIGGVVPNTRGSRYATVTGNPTVFAMNPQSIKILESDWHEHVVVAKFALDDVARVEVSRGDRPIVLVPTGERTPGGRPRWKVSSGDAKGVDLAQVNPMLEMMSGLTALRFTQYDGFLPALAGLSPPRLQVGVDLQGGQGTRLLRIGEPGPEPGTRQATTASGAEGAVFLINAGAWENWIAGPGPGEKPAPPPAPAAEPVRGEAGNLPENVFKPAPR